MYVNCTSCWMFWHRRKMRLRTLINSFSLPQRLLQHILNKLHIRCLIADMDMIDVPKRPHNLILEIDTESLLVTVYQGVGFRVCAPLEYNYCMLIPCSSLVCFDIYLKTAKNHQCQFSFNLIPWRIISCPNLGLTMLNMWASSSKLGIQATCINEAQQTWITRLHSITKDSWVKMLQFKASSHSWHQ